MYDKEEYACRLTAVSVGAGVVVSASVVRGSVFDLGGLVILMLMDISVVFIDIGLFELVLAEHKVRTTLDVGGPDDWLPNEMVPVGSEVVKI